VVVVVFIFIMKEKIVKSEDAEAMCHFVVLCFFLVKTFPMKFNEIDSCY